MTANPTGADFIDRWSTDDGDAECRCFTHPLTELHAARLLVFGSQWPTAGTERAINLSTEGADHTPSQARELAAELTRLADSNCTTTSGSTG